MHHIICERSGDEVITPSYVDAKRQFKRMVRENPIMLVEWWHTDIDGVHKHVMSVDPS